MTQNTNRTPRPWLSISANGGGPTIKAGTKWVRATPDDIAAMKAAPDLLDALAAARAVLTSILGTDAESRIIAEQVAQIDAALAKARAS